MAAQLVVMEAIATKCYGNIENGCIMFAVVWPPKTTKK
jgi:hypothetical protein